MSGRKLRMIRKRIAGILWRVSAVCCFVLIASVCLKTVTVRAAGIIHVEKRDKTSQTATIIVKGKGAARLQVDFFDYINDAGKLKNKRIRFHKNRATGDFEAECQLKTGEYGIYELSVTLFDQMEDVVDTGEVTFEYRPKKSEIEEGIAVVKPENSIPISGMGTFSNQYFLISQGSGSERFFKTGSQVEVTVLYRTTEKNVTQSQVYLMWGSKKILYSQAKARDISEGGYYYTAAKYVLSSSTDWEGELSTYYESSKGKFSKTSLGVSVCYDGTAPKITSPDYAAKKKVQYFNSDVTVPIIVTDKNFDAAGTSVMVNGKETGVSWNAAGDKQTASVKLTSGSSTISVVSTDKAGNRSEEMTLPEIVVDKKAPTVRISGFENGTGKGRINGEYVPYPVTVTISDNELLDTDMEVVMLYRHDENDGETDIELTNTKNNRNSEYTVDDLKEDGYYELCVYAVDKAGNVSGAKNVKYEGENPFEVSDGLITGEFTINRNGSLYVPENQEIFQKPLSELNDIVIYEYNKNEITEQSVTIIDSLSSRQLTSADYSFLKMDQSDRSEYKCCYKYTIYSGNFTEGIYNIKINSKSIAGSSGSMTAILQESDNLNRRLIVDRTKPRIIGFYGRPDGYVKLKVRDDYLDEDSVYLELDGKKIKLKKNEDDSTSTNVIYQGSVGKNPKGATVYCRDLAGNSERGQTVTVEEKESGEIYLIYIALGIGGLVLVCAAVALTVSVWKRK